MHSFKSSILIVVRRYNASTTKMPAAVVRFYTKEFRAPRDLFLGLRIAHFEAMSSRLTSSPSSVISDDHRHKV